MSNNIEEDIEIIDKLKTDVEISFGGWCNRLSIREKQALENILNKYKKNQNIVDKINNKIKDLQNTCAEIQGTEHEGETVLYLMEIDLLQKLLKED